MRIVDQRQSECLRASSAEIHKFMMMIAICCFRELLAFYETTKRALIYLIFDVFSYSRRVTKCREFQIKIFHANCAFVVTLTAPRLHSVSKCRHAVFLLYSFAFIHHQNTAFALHLKMPRWQQQNASSFPQLQQNATTLRFPSPACASSLWSEAKKKEIIRNNNYYKATKCLAELCRSPMSECVRGSERASRVARYVVCRSLSLLHVAPSRRLFFVRSSCVYKNIFSSRRSFCFFSRFLFFSKSF